MNRFVAWLVIAAGTAWVVLFGAAALYCFIVVAHSAAGLERELGESIGWLGGVFSSVLAAPGVVVFILGVLLLRNAARTPASPGDPSPKRAV